MKVLGWFGCGLMVLGFVWGIFILSLLTISLVGLIISLLALWFDEEF